MGRAARNDKPANPRTEAGADIRVQNGIADYARPDKYFVSMHKLSTINFMG